MLPKEQIKIDAPEGATHFRLTKEGNPRYYRMDCNNDWIVYQDWKYPIQWQKTALVEGLKPL